MSKGVSFGKSDAELIKAIESYQHRYELPNFTEAVRQLCRKAIEFDKINNKKG